MSPPATREKRDALRGELYARVAAGDIALPDAVRMMRHITGRTQIEYAKMVGVSPRILIQLERGIGNPTLKTIAKLIAPFGLEVGLRRRPRD